MMLPQTFVLEWKIKSHGVVIFFGVVYARHERAWRKAACLPQRVVHAPPDATAEAGRFIEDIGRGPKADPIKSHCCASSKPWRLERHVIIGQYLNDPSYLGGEKVNFASELLGDLPRSVRLKEATGGW